VGSRSAAAASAGERQFTTAGVQGSTFVWCTCYNSLLLLVCSSCYEWTAYCQQIFCLIPWSPQMQVAHSTRNMAGDACRCGSPTKPLTRDYSHQSGAALSLLATLRHACLLPVLLCFSCCNVLYSSNFAERCVPGLVSLGIPLLPLLLTFCMCTCNLPCAASVAAERCLPGPSQPRYRQCWWCSSGRLQACRCLTPWCDSDRHAGRGTAH
jgi:hypothetical protein